MTPRKSDQYPDPMEVWLGLLCLAAGVACLALLIEAASDGGGEFVFLWTLLAPLAFINFGMCVGGNVEQARQKQLAIESHAQDGPDEAEGGK